MGIIIKQNFKNLWDNESLGTLKKIIIMMINVNNSNN